MVIRREDSNRKINNNTISDIPIIAGTVGGGSIFFVAIIIILIFISRKISEKQSFRRKRSCGKAVILFILNLVSYTTNVAFLLYYNITGLYFYIGQNAIVFSVVGYADLDEDHYDLVYGYEDPNRLNKARLDNINGHNKSDDNPVDNPYYGEEMETYSNDTKLLRSNSRNTFQNVKVTENPYYEQ